MAEDYKKYPKLREDLKISKMVNKTNTHFVIKDPMKESYFRFSEDEMEIISLFNGERTLEQMVEDYNSEHDLSEIDISVVEEFWNEINGMNLLVKSHDEMNVMLVEKVKEMRQFQLLSKKGSILYKRFPIVDPDKFFDRIIDKVSFFWSRGFFIFSLACMLLSTSIIIANWQRFNAGIFEVFNFSEMSFSHLALLWIIIYATIAIHELGHGLTCKYFGGEVHEIGFLLLFFQPCLYANVNDAWLFDKKYKQILVTIAGGYIEYFIGAIATFIWILSSPNTMVNVLAFQVMTIASISTILFNFNPLIKLDGYYLLSDFLEAPNLKEESAKYMKYLSAKYIFRMPEEPFCATKREKKIYFCYGVASTIWMTLLLTGLVGMAHGIFTEKFYAFGVILAGFVAYKILGGHVTKSGKFLVKWFLQHRSQLMEPKVKYSFGGVILGLVILLFVPIHYKIRGDVTINPSKMLLIRPNTNAEVKSLFANDGAVVKKGDSVLSFGNINIESELKMAELNLRKSEIKLRKTMVENPGKYNEAVQELNVKTVELAKKEKEGEGLVVSYNGELGAKAILSCPDQERLPGSFVKKGAEVCRLYDLEKVKTVISVQERDVAYLDVGQEVDFKLNSDPRKTFQGKIESIRPTAVGDPQNPGRKTYQAEIVIENNGDLRAGMIGVAKVYGHDVSIARYLGVKVSSALRMDLFY